ncbi:MAG TPA: ExeM/NucH family extracellular endonuclease [Opitutaceae bacterium]|nr:ExeM/NucH family extracellular endonuclease [Opitutaceae bacterium]
MTFLKIARFCSRLLGVGLFLGLAGGAAAQSTISYTGGSYTQNFDTLPSSGTFTFPASGPYSLDAAPINAAGAPGWSLARVGGSGTVALFFFGTGSSTTGGVYSFGAASNAERAFGTLQSGTNVAVIGAVFVNNTGVTISQFTLGFTGEQWRKGGSTAQDRINFEYSVGATSISAGTFTAATALNFAGPIFNAGAGLLDGNLAVNRTVVSPVTVSGLSWGPGQSLAIRWTDFNVTSSDDGLAVDDVTFTTPVGTGPTPPAVNTVAPVSGAVNVSVSEPVTVTFNQPVVVSGAWFTLTGATSGAHTATVSGGPSAFTLTPDVPFVGGELVTLTIFSAQVTDQATGALHPAADFTTSYTTVSSLPLSISQVQGSGTASPYVTQIVTIEGIVTASFQGAGKIGGYYIQTPVAQQDADAATSEGIYIFDNANSVTLGDHVTITGTVTEFGAAPNSETEITPVNSFTKNSTGNPLPSVTTVNLPFPSTGFAERYEGMRVTLPQTLTVTDNFDYGHFGELVLSNGRLASPTNIVAPGAPAVAQSAANRLNQILLDDGVSTAYPDPTPFLSSADPATATRRAGSTATGVTGILGNKFGSYVIEPTAAPAFAEANPRVLPSNPGGTLHVAIGNVLNFFNGNGSGGGFPTSRGADTFVEYQRQRAKIVAGISAIAPDIMGLTEIENDGFGPLSAIQDLVNGLNATAPAGTTYAFVNLGLPTVGTDLITCGFIYKTNTVALVGAPAVNMNSVFNRPPIAQTFRQISNGEKLTVTINHFKSKSGPPSSGPDVDTGDGQSAWNPTRTAQANALTLWLATNPTGDADPDVLIVGDLNAYAKEDPITAIKSAGFTNLTEAFEGVGGYSYAFGGEFGHLDHALGTASLTAQVTGAESWHANADEPVYYDYNTENKNAAQQAVNAGTGYRYSDHDPVVIGLNLASGPPAQPYAAWASAKGLTPANDSPTADPDIDAIVNLMEYFLGLDPTVSNPQGLPVGQLDGGDFVFRFNRAKSITGVTYRVLVSSDLVNWTPTPVAPLLESETATLETFVVRLPASSPKLFARLEVTLADTVVALVSREATPTRLSATPQKSRQNARG